MVDVLYYMCQRAAVAEALATVAAEDAPTEDTLRGYTPQFNPEQSLAWGPLFVKAAMWLNDYEVRKKKKQSGGGSSTPGGVFDYHATEGWE